MLSRYSCVASDSVSMDTMLAGGSDLDEDLARPHGDGERLDVLGRRQAENLSGADVEGRAVTRADHPVALPVALAERPVVVAAAILERVVAAVDQVRADEQRT